MITVLLDVDGVIADFRHLYVKCCNEANGTNFTAEQTGLEWDFAVSLGISKKQQRRTWDKINEAGVANTMELLRDAHLGVRTLLHDPRVRVQFVTSQCPNSPTWCYDRIQWLSRVFGIEAVKHVTYTHSKELVRGNVFVDDKPQNVLKWKQAFKGPDHVGILWDPDFDGSGFDRCRRLIDFMWTSSWDDVHKVVAQMHR